MQFAMIARPTLCPLVGLLVASLAGPALAGDCNEIYPDEQVAAFLAKPEVAACSLNSLRADYAEILSQQARLLVRLRPAYERVLMGGTEFNPVQLRARLDEYDGKIQTLKEITEALRTNVAESESDGEAGGERGEWSRIGKILKQSKQLSQALESKIILAKDVLDEDEHIEYCKLNFHFRLRFGLHAKIHPCLERDG